MAIQNDDHSEFVRFVEERRNKLKTGLIKSSVVVPLNLAFPLTQKVLTDEQVKERLLGADLIALTECGCRARLKGCTAPLDTCIVMDSCAERHREDEAFRTISAEEAMEVLDRTAEHGLVHLTLYTDGHQVDAICSCCGCCCHDLKAMFDFGQLDMVLKSDYIAVHDRDLCVDCGTCIERCHFNAFSEKEDRVVFSSGRCFGCGVCVVSCPSEAISLEER